MDLKWIVQQNVPRWYELGFEMVGSVPGIVLRISEDLIAKSPVLDVDQRVIVRYLQDFGVGDFQNDFSRDFGFDGVMINKGSEDGFRSFQILLPEVFKKLESDCNTCKGSGESPFGQGECFSCDGDGKRRVFDYYPARVISATMTVLTDKFLEFPKFPSSSTVPQLLNFNTVTLRGNQGGSVSGEFSIPLVKWLRSLPEGTVLGDVVEAMDLAWGRMMGNAPFRGAFKALVRGKGGLFIDCPAGDAAGINPEGFRSDDEGYNFESHNMDSPAQQLAVLAGLGALHRRAWSELQSSRRLRKFLVMNQSKN